MQSVNSALLRFGSQWVAGQDVESAISRALDRNKVGIKALINLLGEHVVDSRVIEWTVSEYVRLLNLMDRLNVAGAVSFKPTQLGIHLGHDYWLKQAERFLEDAAQRRRFVWIDMESSAETQETIDGYMGLKPSYNDLGICVQSYLKRSMNDVERLSKVNGIIRVVKGAYNESASIAFKERPSISRNFTEIMGRLFEQRARFAVATHDDSLVAQAIQMSHQSKAEVEYQFLLGVRNELKMQVLHLGYPVVEYIPYGTEWLSYSYRRIREKKSNIILLFRSFLSGGA